jgi:murein DD-endopeptidase MepM/ murein hydrolase activator NlpD
MTLFRESRVRWRTLAAVLVGTLGLTATGAPATAATCWFPPVQGTIVDPFRAPPCEWCAGNRGLEYRVGTDVEVRAAASGRVEFAGTVVGVDYVVIRLANGWRHTYGRLTSTTLQVGDVVFADRAVGTAADTFFFSLRVGDDYADPAPYLGELRTRPRLIPTDGTPSRPAPPARPRCAQPRSAAPVR